MEWTDSAEQADFRAEVRGLIESRLPALYRSRAESDAWARLPFLQVQSDRLSEDAEVRAAGDEWVAALAEHHWVAPHWPTEYGGGGMSPMEQFIFNQEMSQAGAPTVGGIGVSMLGPVLILHGNEEQRREHLPRVLAGEVVWAQGYSEPGAGSDLGSLTTRAVRDGDEYVLDGQKIWTTRGHEANWLFTLARTDTDAPKHRGISFLLLDRNTPGVDVRPLMNMGWEHDFNEVFYDSVRVPAGNLVGEEHRGWYVGMTLLDFERSNISGAIEARRRIGKLVDHLAGPGRARSRVDALPSLRDAVAQHAIEAEVMFNFSFRIISIQHAGQVPNYEASVSKLFGSELMQRLANTGTKVFGLHSNLWDEQDERSPMMASFTHNHVQGVSATIASGTSEIQRNVIATRGLGLPRG
jgi:alkylation response protein AidB-like acyl-CoA dehydrogenase